MSETKPAPNPRLRRAWKWIAGAFTALLTVAGFASPEFRDVTCLDLPSPAELRYAPESSGARSFKLISAKSQQSALDGEQLVFRARYFGETLGAAYGSLLGADKQQGYAYLNLRPLDFVAEATPLGSTAAQLPDALVLMPTDKAAALVGLAQGAVIEVQGVGHWRTAAEPGTVFGFNDFYVLASDVQVLTPENAPENRNLCRLFHDLDS